MAAKRAFDRADGRPRIHLWPDGTWSRGPNGLRNRAQSVGDAVEWALDDIERQPAVIIWEGEVHG